MNAVTSAAARMTPSIADSCPCPSDSAALVDVCHSARGISRCPILRHRSRADHGWSPVAQANTHRVAEHRLRFHLPVRAPRRPSLSRADTKNGPSPSTPRREHGVAPSTTPHPVAARNAANSPPRSAPPGAPRQTLRAPLEAGARASLYGVQGGTSTATPRTGAREPDRTPMRVDTIRCSEALCAEGCRRIAMNAMIGNRKEKPVNRAERIRPQAVRKVVFDNPSG